MGITDRSADSARVARCGMRYCASVTIAEGESGSVPQVEVVHLQARTRAVSLPSEQGQPSSEAGMAASASPQNSNAAAPHQQGQESGRKGQAEQDSKQSVYSSEASRNLDVRWNERLVLELPTDAEEDEVISKNFIAACYPEHTEAVRRGYR